MSIKATALFGRSAQLIQQCCWQRGVLNCYKFVRGIAATQPANLHPFCQQTMNKLLTGLGKIVVMQDYMEPGPRRVFEHWCSSRPKAHRWNKTSLPRSNHPLMPHEHISALQAQCFLSCFLFSFFLPRMHALDASLSVVTKS